MRSAPPPPCHPFSLARGDPTPPLPAHVMASSEVARQLVSVAREQPSSAMVASNGRFGSLSLSLRLSIEASSSCFSCWTGSVLLIASCKEEAEDGLCCKAVLSAPRLRPTDSLGFNELRQAGFLPFAAGDRSQRPSFPSCSNSLTELLPSTTFFLGGRIPQPPPFFVVLAVSQPCTTSFSGPSLFPYPPRRKVFPGKWLGGTETE